MTEIEIELYMEENYDIKITNNTVGKEFIVKYSDKKISASDVYDLLTYQDDFLYKLKSNIEIINVGNEKDYFNEILIIMNDIVKELNELNNSIKNNDDLVETSEEEIHNDELVPDESDEVEIPF